MALIPFSMFDIFAFYNERGGFIFLAALALIAYSFIYFSGIAIYGILELYSDYGLLIKRLGIMYKLHGIFLIIGGLAAAIQMIRKKMFYSVSGFFIGIGSFICLITGLLGLSETGLVAATFLRNAGFVICGFYMFKNSKIPFHAPETG